MDWKVYPTGEQITENPICMQWPERYLSAKGETRGVSFALLSPSVHPLGWWCPTGMAGRQFCAQV